jgi:hypothetical protein
MVGGQPGVVVLDPGKRDWLGTGPLHVGDCICARRGSEQVTDARSLANLLLDAHQAVKPNERAWMWGTIESFDDGVTNGGPRFSLSLAKTDLAELRAVINNP